ncbi:MAG: DUF465 domain-containing protein [Pseudomonadota bacterium]
MSHVPHELAEQFPELKDKIHDLKVSNAHFARLAEDYHELNREIHRVEANGIDMDDAAFETLKKRRLVMLDEISRLLHG